MSWGEVVMQIWETPASVEEGPCQDWPMERWPETAAAVDEAVARWWGAHGDGSALQRTERHHFSNSPGDGSSWVRVGLHGDGPIGTVRVYPDCRVEPEDLSSRRAERPAQAFAHDVGPCQHWPEDAEQTIAAAAERWWRERGGSSPLGYAVRLPEDGSRWAWVDLVEEGFRGWPRGVAWLRVDRACRVQARPRTCIHCFVSRGWLVSPDGG